MKIQSILVLIISIFGLILSMGFIYDNENPPVIYKEVNVITSTINETSSIENDLSLLNIESSEYENVDGLVKQSKVIALIEIDGTLFLYFYLADLTKILQQITIDSEPYELVLNSSQNHILKYAIKLHKPLESKILISRYIFDNGNGSNTTISVQEEHFYTIEDGLYYYDSNSLNYIEIEGQMVVAPLIDNTPGNTIIDFLGRSFIYTNTDQIQTNQIQLFYYFFNTYDKERNQQFNLENIVAAEIGYREKNIVFDADIKKGTLGGIGGTGIEDPWDEAVEELNKYVLKDVEEKTYEVTFCPENFIDIMLQACKKYTYNTIYDTHELEDQSIISQFDGKTYSYAIMIGNEEGYRFSEEIINNLFSDSVSFDYEETRFSEVSVFKITYQERGMNYTVNVDSIVNEELMEIVLPVEDINIWTRLMNWFDNIGSLLAYWLAHLPELIGLVLLFFSLPVIIKVLSIFIKK